MILIKVPFLALLLFLTFFVSFGLYIGIVFLIFALFIFVIISLATTTETFEVEIKTNCLGSDPCCNNDLDGEYYDDDEGLCGGGIFFRRW